MKRPPNSKSNLERAISRYVDNDAVRANELAVALSNAIVAQMIGAGVVKGGSSLKLRYGDKATRVTKDLDTAWSRDLDSFLKEIREKLKLGWNGFTGEVVVLKDDIDMVKTSAICRELFRYRRKQPWPTFVVKNENWDEAYIEQKGNLDVLPTVGDAIVWVNELITKISFLRF